MACTTQAFAGFKGQIFVSTDGGSSFNGIAEITEMSLNLTAELEDATSHDSAGWREFIEGLKTWSIDTETMYITASTTKDDLFAALVAGSELLVRFRPNDTVGQDQFEGSVKVGEFTPSSPLADPGSLSVTLQGSGPLVKTTIV